MTLIRQKRDIQDIQLLLYVNPHHSPSRPGNLLPARLLLGFGAPPKQMEADRTSPPGVAIVIKGSLAPPKRMNFWKNSKRPLIWIFSEIHDQSIVYIGKNLQYKFLDWKWSPPTPPLELFQKFIKFGKVRLPSGVFQWRIAKKIYFFGSGTPES